MKGSILVIRGGAIGDFILTLPAIAALRRQFPEAHLEVLGYPHIIQLAVAGGLVDRVQSIEARALAGFFARAGTLSQDLADYFSDFDLIVSYLYDPDDIFQTNIGRCSSAQFIAGPHRPDEHVQLHAAKVYLKPLERLAIFDADHVPSLTLAPETSPTLSSALPEWAQTTKDSTKDSTKVERGKWGKAITLALHPGSGSERKNWPEVRWAALIEELVHSTGLSLLLIGGEAEGQRLDRLSAGLPSGRVRLARNLALTDLARRLGGCTAFVGHDSGISHLAAAVGLPGVLLWGDTAEAIWQPPSQKMTVLRHPAGLAKLEVEEVMRALGKCLQQTVQDGRL